MKEKKQQMIDDDVYRIRKSDLENTSGNRM